MKVSISMAVGLMALGAIGAEDFTYWYGKLNANLIGSLTDQVWVTYTNDYNGVGGDLKYPTEESSAYIQTGIATLSENDSFKVANFSVGRGWGGHATNIVESGSLTVTGLTEIGWWSDGFGWLDVRGGEVDLGKVHLAASRSLTGHMSVSGGEASVSDEFVVGASGNSQTSLTQTGGSITVTGNETKMGLYTGSKAEWKMTGGTYTGNTIFLARDGGTGVWNMTGGTVNLASTSYGVFHTGWGKGDAEINLSGDANVKMTGDVFIPRGGGAQVSVDENATLSIVDGNLHLGYDDNCSTGRWDIVGGAVTVSGSTYIGQGANNPIEMNVTGGSLTAGAIEIGRGVGAEGTLNVAGGDVWAGTLLMNENTDASSVLKISDGTLTTANSFSLKCSSTGASEKNRVEMTGGTWNMQGDELFFANADNYDPRKTSLEMTVSGGTINGHTIHVGRDGGTGTLNITGGEVTLVNDSEEKGWYGAFNAGWGAKGTINISDKAKVDVTGTMLVPREGEGTLNVSGGSLSLTGSLQIGDVAGKCTGKVTVSGGEVTVSDTTRIGNGDGNSGTLTVSGGAFTSDKVKLGTDGNADVALTLQGGTLTTRQIYVGTTTVGDGCTQQVVFDGGTLVAGAARTDFIADGLTLAVTDNGAVIDTDYAVTVIPAFTAAEEAKAATLVKKGTGTLSLTADYTLGSLTVVNGTVAFGGAVDSLAVTFDPVVADLEPGTYTLATGLSTLVENDSLTHALSTASATYYDVDWSFSDGTLVAVIDYKDEYVYTITGEFEVTSEIAEKLAEYRSVQATGPVTLTASTDLTTVRTLILAADAWIDLNGHDLTLDAYHASLGTVITNSSETAATLRLGANGGTMTGNAYVAIGGNLTVSLEGATDTTGFNDAITFTHTGGWYFKDNDYAITVGSMHIGTGTVTFDGNGGFSPNRGKPGESGRVDDNWYDTCSSPTIVVNGEGNKVSSAINGWLWEFFRSAKVSGSGELSVIGGNSIELDDKTSHGDADWSEFTGTLVLDKVEALTFGVTETMKAATICLSSERSTKLSYREKAIHLGDLTTQSSEYSENPYVGMWGDHSKAEWYIGYANHDSTFAGKFVDVSYSDSNGDHEVPAYYHKVGTGTWTLNAVCENKGAFYADEGRLDFLRTVAEADVEVAKDATLGGSGELGGAVTFASGANLAAGSAKALTAPNADVTLTGVNLVIDDPDAFAEAGSGKTYTVFTAKSITGKPTLVTTLPGKPNTKYVPAIVTNDDGSQSVILKDRSLGLRIVVR